MTTHPRVPADRIRVFPPGTRTKTAKLTFADWELSQMKLLASQEEAPLSKLVAEAVLSPQRSMSSSAAISLAISIKDLASAVTREGVAMRPSPGDRGGILEERMAAFLDQAEDLIRELGR